VLTSPLSWLLQHFGFVSFFDYFLLLFSVLESGYLVDTKLCSPIGTTPVSSPGASLVYFIMGIWMGGVFGLSACTIRGGLYSNFDINV
jgi:hypothetical protein